MKGLAEAQEKGLFQTSVIVCSGQWVFIVYAGDVESVERYQKRLVRFQNIVHVASEIMMESLKITEPLAQFVQQC